MVYSHSERRTLLVSAVAFVALIVAGLIFALPDSPARDASGAEILRYYDQRATEIGIAAWLFTLAAVPFLCFLAQLGGIIRRSGEDARVLATAAFGGGVAGIAMLAASNAATIAAVVRVAVETNPLGVVGAMSLWDLGSALYVMSAIPLAVLVAAAAAASLRHAIMPAWLAVAGLLVGAVLVVPFVAWIGLGLFVLWVLAVGLALSRRAEEPHRVSGTTARPTPA